MKEFRAATLREELAVISALMALGYYPYDIKFNCSGGLELKARGIMGNEKKLIEKKETELNS
jgi:hypothetical protein